MVKIERVSENICLAKCAHTSVWTTQALGACLKVYTFHFPSLICSDSQSFPKAYFSQFGKSILGNPILSPKIILLKISDFRVKQLQKKRKVQKLYQNGSNSII